MRSMAVQGMNSFATRVSRMPVGRDGYHWTTRGEQPPQAENGTQAEEQGSGVTRQLMEGARPACRETAAARSRQKARSSLRQGRTNRSIIHGELLISTIPDASTAIAAPLANFNSPARRFMSRPCARANGLARVSSRTQLRELLDVRKPARVPPRPGRLALDANLENAARRIGRQRQRSRSRPRRWCAAPAPSSPRAAPSRTSRAMTVISTFGPAGHDSPYAHRLASSMPSPAKGYAASTT